MTKEYISLGTVTRVEERHARSNWRKGASGVAECDTVSLGWFLIIRGDGSASFSIGVGAEKPAFESGDTIKLTLTKV